VICRLSRRYEAAIDHYQKAIICAASVGDRAAEAKLNGNMGIALRFLGRLDEAVDAYARAIRFGEQAGDTLFAGTHRMNLGVAQFRLGREAEGIESLVSAIRSFDKLDRGEDAERALAALGKTAPAANLPDDIAIRVDALALAERPSAVPPVRAWQQARRARALASAGERAQAHRMMAEIAKSCEAIGDHYHHATALLDWAELATDNEPAEATAVAARAREPLKIIRDPALHARADEILLSLAMRQGDAIRAKELMRELRMQWRSLRGALRDERDRIRFADRASRLTEDYAAFLLAANRPDEALLAYDLGRSQSLLDRVGGENTGPTRRSTLSTLMTCGPYSGSSIRKRSWSISLGMANNSSRSL
jgi:tetratricopeptide (TPR) repeat protein